LYHDLVNRGATERFTKGCVSFQLKQCRHVIPNGVFWLRGESLEDSDNLPHPDLIATEIVEELEAALSQFRLIAEDLSQ
jgi:type I restriction enzyme M protein